MDYFASRKKKVPFSMAIENWELVHECFPKHSGMGTARIIYDKETDEGKKRGGVRKLAMWAQKKFRLPITS